MAKKQTDKRPYHVIDMPYKEYRQICRPSSRVMLPNSQFLTKLTPPITTLFIKLRLGPTVASALYLLLGIVSAFFFLPGTYLYSVIGAILLQISIYFDLVDGELARWRTHKEGKKRGVLLGQYLDKTTPYIHRGIIIISIGIGAWNSTGEMLFLYAGIVGLFFILTDNLLKLKEYESLVNKQRLEHLTRRKETFKQQSTNGFVEFFFEIFRLNNPFTGLFWAAIFSVIPWLVLAYAVLLPLLTVRTYIHSVRYMNSIE